jgi:poly(beta-D-mannuronate) lyase
MLHRIVLCTILALGCADARAESLSAPFQTRAPDAKAAPRPCDAAPEAVVDFALTSKYGQAGASRDTVDREAEAAFEAALRPVKDYAQAVIKSANDYHRTGRVSSALCAARHLAAWAKADALKGPESHTAWFKLATTLSGLSLAYLQVKPALREDSAERKAIEGWLNRRGRDVAGYFEALKTPRSSRNNHRAWAGLAAASAAAASSDRALLARGFESYRLVVCQATAEGALPLEVERGRKATEYHFYALAALATLAEIGERNGYAAYGECASALSRVASFAMAAARDPARMAVLAGAPQEPSETYTTPSRLVFLEPWLVRHPEEAGKAKALLARRPLALTDLGGNQTLLYAGGRTRD